MKCTLADFVLELVTAKPTMSQAGTAMLAIRYSEKSVQIWKFNLYEC